MAAVVPVWQLEEWQKRPERFFGIVEEVWQRNKKVKPEVAKRGVQEAVRAVRGKVRRFQRFPKRCQTSIQTVPAPTSQSGTGS